MTLTGSDYLLRLSSASSLKAAWGSRRSASCLGLVGGWVFVQNLELFLGVTPARERP